MAKSPAFQFYAQDFLVGTFEFTAEEVGGYIRLLSHQWDKGGLPNDDKKLLQLSGIKAKALPAIKAKFSLSEDGLLRNPRLEKERNKQIEFAEKRRDNANKRWHQEQCKDDASALQVQSESNAFHTSSSSSPNTHTQTAGETWDTMPKYDIVPDPPNDVLTAISEVQYRSYSKVVPQPDLLAYWHTWKVTEIAGDKFFASKAEVYRFFSNYCNKRDVSKGAGKSTPGNNQSPQGIKSNRKAL